MSQFVGPELLCSLEMPVELRAAPMLRPHSTQIFVPPDAYVGLPVKDLYALNPIVGSKSFVKSLPLPDVPSELPLAVQFELGGGAEAGEEVALPVLVSLARGEGRKSGDEGPTVLKPRDMSNGAG